MSTIFFFVCLTILIGVIAAISSPFWRKDPTTPELIDREAEEDQERADLSVEREVLLRGPPPVTPGTGRGISARPVGTGGL